MRIKKIHIKNYRSILDSGEVTLDPKITILIGKNESGKTSILKALESFNTDYKYKEEDLCLFSKAWNDLGRNEIDKRDIEIITIWFELSDEDRNKLKEIHPQLANVNILRCTKYFDNTYSIAFEDSDISIESLNINAKKVDEILSEIKNKAISLKEKLNIHAQRHTSFNSSKAQYESIIEAMMDFDPEKNQSIDSFFNNLYSRLRNLPNVDTAIKNDIEDFIKGIDPLKNNLKNALSESITNKILSILPNFIYFADVEKLEDTMQISEFLGNREKHKTLSSLLELAGLNIEKVKDAEEYTMISELRHASTTITGLVNQSWTQEKVNINIDLRRDKIIVSITDNVITRDHPPSIRSQGFQWFLSFYINFTAGSKGELKNTIILLDDPGVYLHPSGQKDLLATLEKIAESNQIIFSTHSPFMIDRNKLERIRIVTKSKKKGTSIEEKFYKSDLDAFHPIRAAIGMTIGDSLFASKANLLVEGYSDELILEAMSVLCFKKGLAHIDTSKISILPVGGADKMLYFALLLMKENLKFLILLDNDPKGREIAKDLKERINVSKDFIFTIEKDSAGEDAEIEDLIDIDFYIKALNLAYSDIFKEKIEKSEISKDDLEKQSFAGVKKFFKSKKLGGLDKIKVAKKIYDLIVAEEEEPDEKTISNFSKLFESINKKIYD